MNPDRVHEQRLRGLDLWRGPVEIEPLPGGITNRNYRVRDLGAGRVLVARLGADLAHLGIDRRSEVACQRAASGLGIAPQVEHHEPGVLVSAHVEARTLRPEDVREPATLARIAERIRALHGGWDRITGLILYFSPFQAARTYAQTARDLGAALPADLDDLLDDARALARRIAPFTPVLCHNDLLAANILDDEAEGRLWLVDWEYAGVGHPMFDLANVASNAGLDREAEETLLRAYLGEINPHALRELRILRAVSSLREALWAWIQTVASDLDFDYRRYALENLDAYRDARARLDAAGT